MTSIDLASEALSTGNGSLSNTPRRSCAQKKSGSEDTSTETSYTIVARILHSEK